jgi:hypothetical protein
MELGGLDPEVAAAFGHVIRDMAINATRTRTIKPGNATFPAENYKLDWHLGSWGRMKLQGVGRLSLDGRTLSHGDFVVAADGVSGFAFQQAMKKGLGGVLGSMFAAICFTKQTGAGMTAELRMDTSGLYIVSQPPCEGLGAVPLATFDKPISQADFNNTIGKVFY